MIIVLIMVFDQWDNVKDSLDSASADDHFLKYTHSAVCPSGIVTLFLQAFL